MVGRFWNNIVNKETCSHLPTSLLFIDSKMTIGLDAQPCNYPSVETVEPSVLVSNSSSNQSLHLPKWVKEQKGSWGERLFVSEWEDEKGYRVEHGWKVRDPFPNSKTIFVFFKSIILIC